ncbi:MAG: hypothetical protein AAFY71_05405 [Bacteroidota bacterium]
MEQYSEEEILQMADVAWEHMDLGEYDEALVIAEELVKLNQEVGYTLKASLLVLQEEPDTAVETLKEGIGKFEGAWRLHMDLANIYAQIGEANAAMEVLDEAEKIEGAQIHWININRGITLFRSGQVDDALNLLQQIEEPEAISEAFSLQLEILDTIHRHDLIVDLIEEELHLLPVPNDRHEASTLANILARAAAAYWYEDEEQEDKIQHYLRQAVEYHRGNEIAMWLDREMDGDFDENSHVYELILEGELERDTETEGEEWVTFHCHYVAAARSPEDALNLIKEYEIEQIDKNSLKILEIESNENVEEAPLGLYYIGELMLILEQEEENAE